MSIEFGFEGLQEDEQAMRKQTVTLDSKGYYQISFHTQWKDEEEAFESDIRLSKEALQMLHELTGEAITRMHEYEILK